MNRRAQLLLAIALAGSLPAFGRAEAQVKGPLERVRVQEFTTPESLDGYPELSELEYLNDRELGVAISGGGTRSASAAWGQLRALLWLGWLDETRYISAVSGGAWTAIPFTFLPEDPDDRSRCDEPARAADETRRDRRRARDESFLEIYRPPQKLTAGDLTNGKGSFVASLSKTRIVALFLSRFLVRKDETYSRALGKRFLDRIGQYDNPPNSPKNLLAPKHRYFVASCAQLERIDEKSVDLTEDDFTVMAENRPFLIAGSSLITKKRFAKKDEDFLPVEITPMYTGVPGPLVTGPSDPIGGGYVESPAYDSFERRDIDGNELIEVVKPRITSRWKRHKYRFTLSDAMGATGAAPARAVRAFGWNLIGFPEFDYLPINKDPSENYEYAHGDGGHIDNLGLIPLLRRGTAKILVFVNSQRPFRIRDEIWTFDEALRRVFDEEGWLVNQKGRRQALLRPRDLTPIVESFAKSKKAGRPLVYCGGFKALTNPRLGISKYEPRICWVYLDRTQKWIEALPSDHKLFRSLKKESGSPFRKFHGFPHFKTFLQRGWKGRVIDLSEEQVNGLAHLTAWTVVESAEYISSKRGLDFEVPTRRN